MPENIDKTCPNKGDAGNRNVIVHLLALGQPGDQRIVTVPRVPGGCDLLTLLNAVFHFGQNDNQPQPHPSVSVGDVIEHHRHYYLVCGTGLHRFPDQAAWMAYRDLDQTQRLAMALRQRPTVPTES